MKRPWIIVVFLFVGFVATIFYFSKPSAQTHELSSTAAPPMRSLITELLDEKEAEHTDSFTSNCPEPHLKHLKCLDAVVTSAEGLKYKIRVKWSRPNMKSKGTVIVGIGGGGGVGDTNVDSRDDAPTKYVFEKLENEDQIRVVQIYFSDVGLGSNPWGGWMVHNGGYKSAAYAFMAGLSFIAQKQIIRGEFLNYMGGSNGTMVMAYAMSHFGIDKYFDRVVFQMGPFLPDLKTTCDPHTEDSIYKNEKSQQDILFEYLGWWRYGNSNRNICADTSDDRLSSLGHIRNFPRTHVHVIVGALETKIAFGQYILNSNKKWFDSIEAKSKSRIVRPNMGHYNSYEDMRRYLKLGPDETPAESDPDYKDNEGEFCAGGKITKFNCRAAMQGYPPTYDPDFKWMKQEGSNCFHLATEQRCK